MKKLVDAIVRRMSRAGLLLPILCAACGGDSARVSAPVNPAQPLEPATAAPAHAPTPNAPNACETHRTALREEYCDPESGDSCDADSFVCEHEGDFDGDGKKERVEVEALGDSITLVIHWPAGRDELLATANRPLPIGDGSDSMSDFGWLLYWEVLPIKNGAYIGRMGKLPVAPGDGDALLVSGGDAAAAIVRRKGSFVMEELGY